MLVADVLPSIMFNSATVVVRLVEPSFNVPYVTVPEVVIAELPLLIDPNPDVIEPELRAPTVVAAVVAKLGMAVISSSKYAAKSVTAA